MTGMLAAAPDAELFERNLAALELRAPGLTPMLRGIDAPQSRLVGSEAGGDLNIDLGHTGFYDPNGRAFVEQQLANYRLRPTRMYINLPKCPATPHYMSDFVLRDVFDHFRGLSVPAKPANPHEHAGFMIVYGIGLGLHLPELVEKYDFRHLILIEQFPEFIYHSMHVVDWAAWLDTLSERGGTVRFLIGRDPAQMAHRLYWDLRSAQFALIDGAYVYRHYHSYLLDQAEKLFIEKLPVLGVAAGFFEDEEKMLRNSFFNLLDYRFSLLEPRPRLEKPVPAIIVGSGPSIDAAIEEVRRLQGQAVIFSCGTSLGVLLRNGIKPDFHCEIENDPQVWEHLSDYRKWTDFDGITLIASTTVDPRVPGLFPERMLFFRDTVSSTGFFGKGFTEFYGTAPTVTNLGLRAAFTFGFKEVYLFGVDLGTRDPQSHHSKDSFYLTDETWQQTYAKQVEPMCHELPANFGGVAHTNRILLWARLLMAGILEQYRDCRVYNCSDGVQIPNTVPRLPSRIKLAATAEAKRRTLRRLADEVVRKEAGALIDRAAIVRLRDELAAFYSEFDGILTTARDQEWDFLAFHDALDALLADERGREFHETVRQVNRGTFMTILQCGYFLARRLPEGVRPEYMRVFVAAVAAVAERMRLQTDGWLAGFLDSIDRRMAA
ncbi:MAG TPA: 6-hydroxymethylpterin diphosphokinase MptE-like protein [Stellaceae bacterium]|nr:6-hydroxymethylpterin diphosphokinase MptE-like protein [Stellaceae bacterium]